MAKRESQLDHYQHSEIKVRLLKRYIDAYLRVIGHSPFFDEIHVYDLFCGEGIYPNGGKGSPIIITEAIHELVSNSSDPNLKKTKFHFTANDKDQNSINSVKKYFASNSDKVSWLNSLEIHNEDYKNFIPRLSKLFSSFKRKKAFVFVDP